MADTRLRAIIESVYEKEGTEQAAAAFGQVGAASEQAAPKIGATSLSLTDLKSGLDLAQQAAATFTGVFKQAFEMGKEGATIIQTTDSLTRLANEAGYAGDLIGDLENAAGGTVDDLDYMGSALKTLTGTSGSLQTELANTLPALLNISRAVVKLNPTVGETSDVFDAMTRALQTGQTRGLKPYGFQIDATASAQEQLTQIMEQGTAMVEKLGGNVESAVDPFNRLENSVDNLKDTLLTALAPALTNAAEGANTLITAYGTTTAALATHNQELVNTGLGYAAYREEMKRAVDDSILVLGGIGGIIELQKILTEEEYAAAVAQAAVNQELAANAQYAGVLSQALTTQLIPSQTDAADAANKVAEAHQREATAFAEAHTNSTLLDGAIDDLAASYDPASTAAGLLKDTIGLLTDTQAEANRLMLEWAIQQKLAEINTDDLTEAEQRELSAELELMLNQQTQLENLETLNQLLADGTITREQARQALADHNLTTEEMNALLGIENEIVDENTEAMFLQEQQTRKGVDAQQAFIDKAPAMKTELNELAIAAASAAGNYDINFNVSVSGDEIPGLGGGTGGTDVPQFELRVGEPPPPSGGGRNAPVGEARRHNRYLDDPRYQTMVALGMDPGLAIRLLMEEDAGTMGGPPPEPMPGGFSPQPMGGGFPSNPRGRGELPTGTTEMPFQQFVLNLYSMATSENVIASFEAMKAMAGVS